MSENDLIDLFNNLELIDNKRNQEIEKFVNEHHCIETEETLSDFSLMSDYIASESYKNEEIKIRTVLGKYLNDKFVINNIIKDYSEHLCKASMKSAIRGKKFNEIVQSVIAKLKIELKMDKYIIQFEAKPLGIKISEKPDWYIQDNRTGKTLIGMNQISLDNGGHQTNRAEKYLYNDNKEYKLVCVICNKLSFGNKSKMNEMILHGIKEKKICYAPGIKNIVADFFSL